MTLTIESSRFGHVEIDAMSVLDFPEGLIGLGGSRYALIAGDPQAPFCGSSRSRTRRWPCR